jgi:hypothetical protein
MAPKNQALTRVSATLHEPGTWQDTKTGARNS